MADAGLMPELAFRQLPHSVSLMVGSELPGTTTQGLGNSQVCGTTMSIMCMVTGMYGSSGTTMSIMYMVQKHPMYYSSLCDSG